ncbi:glycosyltransferase family 2 protein [Ohtaekwangia koreensis]|uniref:Glycosyltransferase involved in cell wall bisynthesis n=1 Tax=Ohtaekwangia koreensis TaxID=688867 RepID=A0A1T5LMM5_9BACT|nr:glycosyltransferase [Ohtaekwangia koreensis]SKC77212.1 Glycosyltransferase involved in cell wall bisynthesis [Ohtaekwangia koreensis]
MPAISVLMPVYNAEQYLRESIASILSQRFVDFEFFIFNDGSTDRSRDIITSFNDPRIHFIDFSDNRGYVTLLNLGLQKAQGKYIARMDADDVAHPDRFQKQFDFLETNPEYVVCGTRFSVIDRQDVVELPIDNDDIKLKMLYITPFCHPSVMMRANTLQSHDIVYDEYYMPAEDHELWVRLAGYGKFANLPEVLLNYRIHDNNVSLKKRDHNQLESLYKSRLTYINDFFIDVSLKPAEAATLHTLFFKEESFSYDELLTCGELLQRITLRDHTYPVASEKVNDLLAERFFYRCTTSTDIGIKSFILARKFEFGSQSFTAKLKLLIKALLKYSKPVGGR